MKSKINFRKIKKNFNKTVKCIDKRKKMSIMVNVNTEHQFGTTNRAEAIRPWQIERKMKMSRQWYGSINNRLEENRQFCKTIEVGTGVTEYSWSDRNAYEVVAVKDQKHVTIRKYDHKPVGEPMSNDWELISNPENPTIDLVKRGDYWYKAVTATREDAESDDIYVSLWLCHNGFDREKILAKGKQTKYHKMNVSFGVANYYYDYEF